MVQQYVKRVLYYYTPLCGQKQIVEMIVPTSSFPVYR